MSEINSIDSLNLVSSPIIQTEKIEIYILNNLIYMKMKKQNMKN